MIQQHQDELRAPDAIAARGRIGEPISVASTILVAMHEVWRLGAALSARLMLPVLSFVGVWTLSASMPQETPSAIPLLFVVLEFVLFTLFTVTCLRVFSLGVDAVPRFGVTRWGRRESHVLLSLIALYFINTLAAVALTTVLGLLAAQFTLLDVDSLRWLFYLCLIPSTYIVVRFFLLLPAWAVGVHLTPRNAWSATRGNGWRLALVLGGIPWLLVVVRDQLLSTGTELWTFAVFGLVGVIMMVFELAALAVSYRTLFSPAAATTDTSMDAVSS